MKILRKILMSTANKKLVEASPYDKVWGIGFIEANAMTNKNAWV